MEFNHDNILVKIFCYKNCSRINTIKLRKVDKKYFNIQKYLQNRYNDVILSTSKNKPQYEYYRAVIVRMKYHIEKAPLCPTCSKPLSIYGYQPNRLFRKFCSYKCSNSDKDKIKQYEEHCLKQYGVKCTYQQRDKVIKTCIKKYGSASALNDPKIQEKRQATLKKHNTFNTSKPEIKLYKLLCNIYGKENIKREYKSDKYPFHCDFYIVSYKYIY